MSQLQQPEVSEKKDADKKKCELSIHHHCMYKNDLNSIYLIVRCRHLNSNLVGHFPQP